MCGRLSGDRLPCRLCHRNRSAADRDLGAGAQFVRKRRARADNIRLDPEPGGGALMDVGCLLRKRQGPHTGHRQSWISGRSARNPRL